MAYKLFCFSSHYTNKLNFTWEAARAAQVSLDRLRSGIIKHMEGTEKIENTTLEEYRTRFLEAINDDLNITNAMGVVWEILRNERKSMNFRNLLCEFDSVLGLKLETINKEKTTNNEEVPNEIKDIIQKRNQARKEKDWKKSDELRDELQKLGYIVKDTKEGMQIEKVK